MLVSIHKQYTDIKWHSNLQYAKNYNFYDVTFYIMSHKCVLLLCILILYLFT